MQPDELVAGASVIGLPFQRPVAVYLPPDGRDHSPAYSFEQREEYALAAVEFDRRLRKAAPDLRDHEVAQLVNQLRDTARVYGDTGQLRSRIQSIILPLFGRRSAVSILTEAQTYMMAKVIARQISEYSGRPAEVCYAPVLFALQDLYATRQLAA
jgi:hypothetical protein